MKKQKEELKNITSSMDVKLTKKLASTLDRKPREQLRYLANAFVGIL